MNSHTITLNKPQFLTLSDFDQCMLLTEQVIKPIALRGLYKSVRVHPRFRNSRFTRKQFDEFLQMCLRRYPGSKTKACMYELDENDEWAFNTYRQSIPEMLDALTTHIQPVPALVAAIEDLVLLNHRFGIITHSHDSLVWPMAEHMRFSHCLQKDDIFDIVRLQNKNKDTPIGWMRAMEHFLGEKLDTHRYAARNWLDDDLKNHHLPSIHRFRRFYINDVEPPAGKVDETCSTFTQALGLIRDSTLLREAA